MVSRPDCQVTWSSNSLKRYHYLDLYRRIKKIIGSDGVLTQDEYEELNRVIKTKLTNEKTSFKNLFGQTKGRKEMQHKPRHRQQQDNAGMLGHGTRKSLNLMPDYQRKDPRKSEGNINRAKATNRVIRVKQGSPQAMELAKKYRIEDPRGEKTVAGNQHDEGITIIFESEKIKRFKKGSCMYKAELTTHNLLKKGIKDFKIIEGYVKFDEDVHDKYEHTWIILKGKTYDPTLEQFKDIGDISSVEYLPKTEFTPKEYLDHCKKYPLEDDQKELLEQKISKISKFLDK
jgi:hypothetical protein